MPHSAGIVRFGVIGAGRIAQRRIAPSMLQAHRVEFVAAASREIDRARSLGAQRAYGSYEALLDDPDVDAVFVTVHNGLHKSVCVEALARGKHVLCEKPLGRDVAECDMMFAAARASGKLLAEAFMYRHRPQIAMVQALMRDGRIGDLRGMEASFHFRLTREEDVRWNAAWGGGSLLDVGCYCIDAIRLFMGVEPSRVRALGRMHAVHGVDTEVRAILAFPDGRQAGFGCGFESGLHQQVTLIGTTGTIRIHEPFIARTEHAVISVLTDHGDERILVEPVDAYRLEIEHFAAAIVDGAAPAPSPDDSRGTARVLEDVAREVKRRR